MAADVQKTSNNDLSVHLSPEEKEVYEKLFHEADPGNVGVLLGENSVKFFEKTGLSAQILGEIWKIADDDNLGFLTQKKFNIALRLVAHAQEGRQPSLDLINLKCPLPKFNEKSSINWNIRSQIPDRIPLITMEERNRYQTMFKNLKLTNDLIKGSQAKTIFSRTHLPNEVLGHVWNLVDVHHRGALNITEFTVAMHLIHSIINGSLKTLPSILPPGIFNMAAGKTYSHGPSHRLVSDNMNQRNPDNLGIKDSSNFLQKHYKHQHMDNQSNTFFQFDTNLPTDWNIKPHERSQYINLFKSINKANENYITGNEAVSFFLSSKLPEKTLAHIWDLADMDKSGKLNKEEFIIAMHLIRQKLTGVDLPATLPQELMPPFLQKNFSQENSYLISSSNQEPPSSITNESFDLNNSFSSQTQLASPSVPSSVFPVKHVATESYIESPKPMPSPNSVFSVSYPSHSKTPSVHSSHRTPFVPVSNFGQSILSSVTSKDSLQKSSTATIDLLGDADTGVSEKDGNMNELESNSKISSLNKQIQELKQTRTSIESDLNAINIEKHDIEERLAQIHILYNKEVKIVQKIQEHLTESRMATQKLKNEYSALEEKLYTLKNKKQEQLQDLERNTKENIELQHKIELISNQLSCLKEEVEEIEKKSLNQKNMTIINKKQLSIFEDNYTQLKASTDEKVIRMQDILENISSNPRFSISQSSNPFHQISDFNTTNPISSIYTPTHDDINITNKSYVQEKSINNIDETIYNKELETSFNNINNQSLQMKQNHQLEESYNPKVSSLINSPTFMENIIQKDLSSNADMSTLKRHDSLTESLNSSVVVQPPESTPGKLSRLSSYPGTPIPWTMNKGNSPKMTEESYLDLESDNVFPKDSVIKELNFYEENPHNNLEAIDILTHSKKKSEEFLYDTESKKMEFNINDLNATLLCPSKKEDISSDINLESDNILHEKCNIRYLNIHSITEHEENMAETLPGTFPIDYDSKSINNENVYYSTNDEEKNKDDRINNKTENTLFDPFLSENKNSDLPKDNKADFDEAFENLVLGSEELSSNDDFTSKFPPIEDFHNLPDPNDVKDFNNDPIVYNKDKLATNLSIFDTEYNIPWNKEVSTVDEKNITISDVTQSLNNDYTKNQPDGSLSDLDNLDSKNIEIVNTALQSKNITEKNEDELFYDLVMAKEVNSFESDFSPQNPELNTFFIEPFSKESKNDWGNVNGKTIFHSLDEHKITPSNIDSTLNS